MVVFTTGANILERSFRQRLYLRNEFHYLNVPGVGTVMTEDDFACTFKCLSNPLCFSINLASSKGTDGKFWCELLSSDKYNNSEAFRRNMSSHHYSILVGYSLTWTDTYIYSIQIILGLLNSFFLLRIYFVRISRVKFEKKINKIWKNKPEARRFWKEYNLVCWKF